MATSVDEEQSIPEIWFEPADPRRLAVLLRRMILAVLVVVAAGSLLLTVRVGNRIAEDERFEDRQLAAALAAAGPSVRADLAAAAGREAMVVEHSVGTTGATTYAFNVLVAEDVPDPARMEWLQTVAIRVGDDADEWFSSTSNTGERWWHTTARISAYEVLVIYRPESRALATANALRLWIAGLGGLIVTGLAILWLVLRARVESSTNTLMEAVEDLRVRGEIRSSTKQQLAELPERPIELKRLARAVTEIETEIRGAFSEIDSLLRGAEALGSSLDPTDVLSASLEHLEQLIGVERSAIVQLDHRRETSTVVAIHGHDQSFRDALANQPYDPRLPSVRASRERQTGTSLRHSERVRGHIAARTFPRVRLPEHHGGAAATRLGGAYGSNSP